MSSKVVGIVNLTRDSFSDGGRFLDPSAAAAHMLTLEAEGADALELGACASNPDADRVSATEEIERIESALEKYQGSLPIYIDTYQPEVMNHFGGRVAAINDIRAFDSSSALEAVAPHACVLIAMHAVQRGPANRSDGIDSLADIFAFFDQRLEAMAALGIARERIVVDPGMGFFVGPKPDHSLQVLAGLKSLRDRYGCPIMISVSRKSFLGELTGRKTPGERGAATLAAELWALMHAAPDYIRTHDVGSLKDGMKVFQALNEASAQQGSPSGRSG